MNSQLHDIYSNVSVHATEDREHEAALELLLLVMIADHHINTDELDEIRTISAESGWDGSTFSFEQYVGPAMAKVRQAVSSDAIEEFLDSVDSRITSTVLRASLFSAARSVAGVDDHIDPHEHNLLARLAARFD